MLHQVVGRLLGHVRVLLQEDGILGDLVGDLVLGVLGVVDAEGQVGVESALGRRLGVAVAAVGRAVRGRVRRYGVRTGVRTGMGMGRRMDGAVRGGSRVVRVRDVRDGGGGQGDCRQGHQQGGCLERRKREESCHGSSCTYT